MQASSSNRSLYDTCNYQKRLYESTSPLLHQTYFGAVENVNKCRDDPNFFPLRNHPTIIDIESDLRNQTRPYSKCDQFKYSPSCTKSGMCISTFDKAAPVVLAAEVCPIVFNNIPRWTTNGLCRAKNQPTF